MPAAWRRPVRQCPQPPAGRRIAVGDADAGVALEHPGDGAQEGGAAASGGVVLLPGWHAAATAGGAAGAAGESAAEEDAGGGGDLEVFDAGDVLAGVALVETEVGGVAARGGLGD